MQKRVFVLSTLLLIAIVAVFAAEPASIVLSVYLSEAAGSVPLPDRAAPHLPVEARHQDVADLRLLPNFDRSFTPISKAAFLRGIDALDGEAGTMASPRFEMAVSRLVALAGNAHTTVSKKQRAGNFGRVPLRFAWFADGLYVVRAKAPADGLLGRKIVSIDGRSVEQALTDLHPYISGTIERARDDSPPLLESPALLRALWPDTDGETLAIGFEGGVVEQVVALPPAFDPFALQPIMAIGPGAVDADWKTVLGAVPQVPLSLREPGHVAYSAPLDADGIYLRINANENDERGALADQLATIAATKPAGGWRRVVLDLRFNDGGDETKTSGFSHAVPSLLSRDGQVWILTGNATFSAAIITTARIRHFMGTRAHIVGEPVGDHNPFWSGGGPPLVLRNSGIAIAHAYFKQDWVNGCYDLICNPLQFLYGVAAGDLSPDVTVGWSFADYAAGRDTVLERALELSH